MIQQAMKSIAILRPPQANRLRALALASVCIVAGVVPGSAAGGPGESPSVPDFTRGGKKDDSHDWNLGPTGARGWIHTSAGHSALARQILVMAVAKGSPADGILEIGDVILGVSEKPFADAAQELRPRPPAEPPAGPRGSLEIKFPISPISSYNVLN